MVSEANAANFRERLARGMYLHSPTNQHAFAGKVLSAQYVPSVDAVVLRHWRCNA